MNPADRPDERFTLANERTFLAWMRTALGLLAAGVAVNYVVPDFSTHLVRGLLAVALVGLACLAAAEGFRRWRRVDQALVDGSSMPSSRSLAVFSTVLVGVGCAAILALAVDLLV